MKKEKYEVPQVELIEIATSDVIMTSTSDYSSIDLGTLVAI